MRSARIMAAAFAAAVAASAAVGQTPPSADAGKSRGEAIFQDRCKDCHDPAVERAPSRQDLAARTPDQIVAALTTGPMTPVAEGLTPQDKQAVAAYLTARP